MGQAYYPKLERKYTKKISLFFYIETLYVFGIGISILITQIYLYKEKECPVGESVNNKKMNKLLLRLLPFS